jgi:hypothetical protein
VGAKVRENLVKGEKRRCTKNKINKSIYSAFTSHPQSLPKPPTNITTRCHPETRKASGSVSAFISSTA